MVCSRRNIAGYAVRGGKAFFRHPNSGMAMNMDTALLQLLACPKCRGELTLVDRDGSVAGLACAACKLVYPVEVDIPVLLIEEAVPQADWK